MKIAFIGIRGIPVIYSAFETFAENLAQDLMKDNYDIWIYCRSLYVDKTKKKYKGINLIVLPSLKSKNFETFIHTFISTIHACFFKKYDVIYYFGVGNALFALLPKILGIKTVINVDGLDWKREKWGYFAKKFLKFSEYLATIIPNIVISDSLYIKKYYETNYKKSSVFIPYSFHDIYMSLEDQKKLLKKNNLTKNKYFIWVGRIIPDNHLEDFILAYKATSTNFSCIILGDDLYNTPYKTYIKDLVESDRRILFTGYIERKKVYALERNSFAYIETKRSGSTHQSLVEALGLGCFIVANNYHVNKQILQSSVMYYDQDKKSEDLKRILKKITSTPNLTIVNKYRSLTKKLYDTYFSEKKILTDYKNLFNSFKN